MPVVEFAHIYRRFLTQTRSQPQFVQAAWAVTNFRNMMLFRHAKEARSGPC